MANFRYIVIIGALFAVLLSAFQVERKRGCAEGTLCLSAGAGYLLPVSRLFFGQRELRRAEQ